MEIKKINLTEIMQNGRVVAGTKKNLDYLRRNYKIHVCSVQPRHEVCMWLKANELDVDEVIQDVPMEMRAARAKEQAYQKLAEEQANGKKSQHDPVVQGDKASPVRTKRRYKKRDESYWQSGAHGKRRKGHE